MCLWFASGCRLCKSWAGASSQPGGQTRKQMDPFGLNPSHAISSSWPSSSNQQASLQHRWRGVCVFMLKFGGWVVHGILQVPSRKTDRNQREQVSERERERERPFLTDSVCAELCWHMAPASMLELPFCSVLCCPLFLLWYSAVCSLSLTCTLLVCPKKSLPFLGCSYHTLWDLLAVFYFFYTLHPLLSRFCCLVVGEVSPATCNCFWFQKILSPQTHPNCFLKILV